MHQPGFRSSVLGLWGALLLSLAFPVPGAAQTALAADGVQEQLPGFLIQTIAVEGTQREASRSLLIEESLLEPGRTYSERELREAVYRIRRLPFVLSADFSLRRGTERGTYELVIAIQETTRFFFGREENFLSIPDDAASEALGYSRYSAVKPEHQGLAGLRLFAGARNVVFGSMGSDGLQAGYTRYGLFGTRAVATLGVAQTFCCPREVFPLGIDPDVTAITTGESTRYSAAVAIPLAGNHSVRTSLSWSRSEPDNLQFFFGEAGRKRFFGRESEFHRLQLDLKWVYDNSDDPLFPSDGVTLAAGLEVSDRRMSDTVFEEVLAPYVIFVETLPDSRATLVAVAASGQKTWPLTPRQAASANLRMAVGRSSLDTAWIGDQLRTQDVTALEVTTGLRHSLSLWGFERSRRFGDLRLETTADYGYEALTPRLGVGSVGRFRLGTSVAFRNRWGLFRVGFTYLDFNGGRR